jgi:hypothetical protein
MDGPCVADNLALATAGLGNRQKIAIRRNNMTLEWQVVLTAAAAVSMRIVVELRAHPSKVLGINKQSEAQKKRLIAGCISRCDLRR